MNPESRTMLPKLAFTGFASRYREPKVEEGFQDIVTVDFEVCPPSIVFFQAVCGCGCVCAFANRGSQSSRAMPSSRNCGRGTGYDGCALDVCAGRDNPRRGLRRIHVCGGTVKFMIGPHGNASMRTARFFLHCQLKRGRARRT